MLDLIFSSQQQSILLAEMTDFISSCIAVQSQLSLVAYYKYDKERC